MERHHDASAYILTGNGFLYARELQNKTVNSKQAFVAMWFSDEMDDIYRNYIEKAIKEAKEINYYKPMHIDKKEHTNKICDEIIAEIRKSRFLIAYFTGQRGGVYYEAGFAHGLGIPVIFTCRKDWFDGYVKQEITTYDECNTPNKTSVRLKENVHFDIRQYNCIVWENLRRQNSVGFCFEYSKGSDKITYYIVELNEKIFYQQLYVLQIFSFSKMI